MPPGYEGVVVKKSVLGLFISLSVLSGFFAQPASIRNCAYAADESWKSDFEKVCGQTDNAADLTIEELKKTLEKCDALKSRIEALEPTPRKIYLKRLQMCRNLFQFMLDSREKK
jgi:DNA-directed RNA polymerase subunit E'/Rpb7